MKGMIRAGVLALAAALIAAAAGAKDAAPTGIRLVESWPLGTTLDHPDIPDAADEWPRLIGAAKTTLDFAEFYASDDPAGGGRLKPVIMAIEKAAKRGVKVRFLAEEKFYRIYPEIIDRFAKEKNIMVRCLDSAAFDGGVLHAKYFIVDGTTAYIGSQNFDWRSLQHIEELGAEIDLPEYVHALIRVYDTDWAIAGLIPPGTRPAGSADAQVDSLVLAWHQDSHLTPPDLSVQQGTWYFPAFSPGDRLPDPTLWDEPQLVRLMDAAKDSIEVQSLTYSPVGRDHQYYDVLENALRRAAARGVKVRLLVSNWSKRTPMVDYIKSLSLVPNIEVRFMDIPEWSGGFIPFARVCHAKYMLVDGFRWWVGTGNWEKDYFRSSRNVGIVGQDASIGAQLGGYFRSGWDSQYAEPVKACEEYAPPKVSE